MRVVTIANAGSNVQTNESYRIFTKRGRHQYTGFLHGRGDSRAHWFPAQTSATKRVLPPMEWHQPVVGNRKCSHRSKLHYVISIFSLTAWKLRTANKIVLRDFLVDWECSLKERRSCRNSIWSICMSCIGLDWEDETTMPAITFKQLLVILRFTASSLYRSFVILSQFLHQSSIIFTHWYNNKKWANPTWTMNPIASITAPEPAAR